MNIYIYGDSSFKHEIQKTLDHANIKFKLGSGYIEYVDSIELLKEAIKSNPEDIYLIDNSKIIDKNSFNAKIKFLKPKDGIEKEFLQEHGIGDLSVDSLDSLVKHINKKIEEAVHEDEEIEESHPYRQKDEIDEQRNLEREQKREIKKDDEEEELIDEELSDLLEYDKWEEDEEEKKSIERKSFLDDDLLKFDEKDLPMDLLSFDEVTDIENNSSIQVHTEIDNIDEELATIMNFDDTNHTNDGDFSGLDDFEELMNFDNTTNLETEKEEQVKYEKPKDNTPTKQGANMSNELDELSGLNEKDILAAIEGIDFDTPPVIKSVPKASSVPTSTTSSTQSQSIAMQGFDLNQISQLLSQLLQNKTLDISIKIRD